jgi:HK97 family phage portal protein
MKSIPVKYTMNGKDVDVSSNDKLTKSIIKAIEDPNGDIGRGSMLEALQTQLYITGESYSYFREDAIKNVSTMQYLRPDKISPITSDRDTVHQYIYNNGTEQIVFDRSFTSDSEGNPVKTENAVGLQERGCFNMAINKNYNPNSEINGLSRLGSCSLSIQGHNESLGWNAMVMKNSGKPSGMLSFGHNEAGSLDSAQIANIKKSIVSQTTRSKNGSILVSNAPAKFEKFSMTSQEMDFIEGTIQRAIEICNALDYPSYLLGLNGATFNNQAEAKLSLFENSAIPKTQEIYDTISRFLSRKYDIDFKIELCVDKVEAMAPRYAEKNDTYIKQYVSNIIPLDEVREKLGYEPAPAGDGDLYYAEIARTTQNNSEPS